MALAVDHTYDSLLVLKETAHSFQIPGIKGSHRKHICVCFSIHLYVYYLSSANCKLPELSKERKISLSLERTSHWKALTYL